MKISDFGLARTLGDDGAREVSLDSQLAIAWYDCQLKPYFDQLIAHILHPVILNLNSEV